MIIEESVTNLIKVTNFWERKHDEFTWGPMFEVDPQLEVLSLILDYFFWNLQKLVHTRLQEKLVILITN